MRMTTFVRTLTLLAAVLMFPALANAYTLVLVDGRKVTIPDTFIVGPSTLTYEAGDAIQITVQLVTVNIAATERLNGGPLVTRPPKSSTPPNRPVDNRMPSQTVTNKDLERYREARLASERYFEQRQKELGLPTSAELKQEIVKSGERAQEQLLSMRNNSQDAERYWRERASGLRADLAAVNAQINFAQGRLNELPLNYSFGGVAGYAPFFVSPAIGRTGLGPTFGGRTFGGRTFGRTFGAGTYQSPTQFSGRVGFANEGMRGRVVVNRFPNRGYNRSLFANTYPYGAAVALPFDAYDTSAQRAALISELNNLISQRAALQARWRELEDEARRAGAYPGWLR